MSANGTPQSYLASQRNQNDSYRDRSMEQSNTNSGNPYNYGPPTNRYIPPTYNPATGQWNTNGESYMTPGAWSGNSGMQVPFWQPNMTPQQTQPPAQTPPPTTAPSSPNGSKPYIPQIAGNGLPPTAVPPNGLQTGANSFGFNGLGRINPATANANYGANDVYMTHLRGSNNTIPPKSMATSMPAPTSNGTQIPANALPQITNDLQQYQAQQQAMQQALGAYGAGGLSQGYAGFMPLNRQLVR